MPLDLSGDDFRERDLATVALHEVNEGCREMGAQHRVRIPLIGVEHDEQRLVLLVTRGRMVSGVALRSSASEHRSDCVQQSIRVR